MVRYVEASFDGETKMCIYNSEIKSNSRINTEDYIQTLGVNFMEKTVSRNLDSFAFDFSEAI